jgi:hypothetical protein
MPGRNGGIDMGHVHHLAGRLRLRLPELERDAALSRSVEQAMRALPDVRLAQVNPVTGSLLIHYEVRGAREAALLRAIEAACARLRLPAPAVSHPGQRAPRRCAAFDALLERTLQRCMERAALALVGALL